MRAALTSFAIMRALSFILNLLVRVLLRFIHLPTPCSTNPSLFLLRLVLLIPRVSLTLLTEHDGYSLLLRLDWRAGTSRFKGPGLPLMHYLVVWHS